MGAGGGGVAVTGSTGWKAMGVSVIGHEHVRREEALQDASAAWGAPRPAAAVCDGAGHAPQSHVGAQAAVRAFRVAVGAMEPLLADILDEWLSREAAEGHWRYAAGWIVRALAAAREEAARVGTGRAADYAFTFAGVVAGRERTGFVQVGDGAICVLKRGGRCALAFPPQKGRYANSTTFVGRETAETGAYLTRTAPTVDIEGIMAMSDGPAVKMVDLTRGEPAPVVGEMIRDFAGGELDRAGLVGYLTGRRWFDDARGGDDKSVVLLAREAGGTSDGRAGGGTEKRKSPGEGEGAAGRGRGMTRGAAVPGTGETTQVSPQRRTKATRPRRSAAPPARTEPRLPPHGDGTPEDMGTSEREERA